MARVILAICGGFHDPQDTDGVLSLWAEDPDLSAIPAVVLGGGVPWAPLSAHALRQSLDATDFIDPGVIDPSVIDSGFIDPGVIDSGVRTAQRSEASSSPHPQENSPGYPDLILWAFSAGGVGAVTMAHHWHRYRGAVRAIFLVDGWGIPWAGNVPCHRLSHDAFTHHSSRLLGAGRADFFAQPAVPHRQLWRSPHRVMGHGHLPPAPHWSGHSGGSGPGPVVSAAQFLTEWTKTYLF